MLENLACSFAGYFTSLAAGTEKLEMLTLSNSSTMLVALEELFKSPLCPRMNLTILESRPLLEGITLTNRLLATKPAHVTIQLATDAAAAYFSARAEYVLLGADQVDPLTGAVKNKIGSLAVATFAKKHSDGREQEGKVICVTSTDKLEERGDHEEEMEENDAEEVSQIWPVNVDRALVTVRNMYFEWVDGGLIDLYMTERGVLSRESISRISQERQELAKVWDILDC